MVVGALVALTVISWVVVLVLHLAQRRLLRGGPPPAAGPRPPVTILKPLKGVDPGLEDNLRSFFRLDYPAYELVFGAADAADPALALARRVAAEFPQVPARFVADPREVGHNPKVNNLANMLEHARHELLLVSDSNVRVAPSHLTALVAALHRPGVGLVTAPIRGARPEGLFGVLEAIQLDTFVMSGVAGVTLLARRACAVGKAMLLRRSTLERIGGFAELARYLAEDQVTGVRVNALGLAAVVAAEPVDNILGKVTLAGFAGRHLRWAKIRRHTSPAGYLAEILTNPLAPALALAATTPGRGSFALLAGTVLLLSLVAAGAERRLGIRRPLFVYPFLEAARGLLLLALWPLPFVSSTVCWRGRRFRIGRATLLEPLTGVDWPDADRLASEEAVA